MKRIEVQPSAPQTPEEWLQLREQIRQWARELGFQDLKVAGTDVTTHAAHLRDWLDQGYAGTMARWMDNPQRLTPTALKPWTQRVLCVRMDYLPAEKRSWAVLRDGHRAYVARYAVGRDYHKIIRPRLQRLAERIEAALGPFGYRAFTDSAPVLEKGLAAEAGLGWIGKHTVLIQRQAGSWFFLGELFTDLPLPVDEPVTAHCGSCQACLDICPTQALVAPYQLDARRCISYLTIEQRGPIPEALRAPIGNRIFGCDDCQLVCPWNRYARPSAEADLAPRHELDGPLLLTLWDWDEATWSEKTAGMALRRAGWSGWRRNLAVALGNAPHEARIIQALIEARGDPATDDLVVEHIHWAIAQQHARAELRPLPFPAVGKSTGDNDGVPQSNP